MWVETQPSAVAPSPPLTPELEAAPKVAVLLNANARKVNAHVLRSLKRAVSGRDLFLSRSEADARRIAVEVVDRGYHTVFLGGGDGTLMCFVNEILDEVARQRTLRPTRAPRFGILKLGTGNSVASLVNASSSVEGGLASDVLRTRRGEAPGSITLDLLSVDGRRAPFAGLGADGQVLNDYNWVKQSLAQGPFSRIMTGPGGYFASVAFRTVPYYLTHSSDVEAEVVNGAQEGWRMGPDGEPVQRFAPGEVLYRGPLMMAAAGTVPYYGFELKMFPFARRRPGLMNLRVGILPTATILANLQRLWAGSWFPEGLKDFLVADATVRFSRPMPFQVAGDAAGYREQVRFQVAPDPIELVDFSVPHAEQVN
jgi:diacylglycerol kinase family enzyme